MTSFLNSLLSNTNPVLFSFSTFLIVYVAARWESNAEIYKSMSFDKESWFYNYAEIYEILSHLEI